MRRSFQSRAPTAGYVCPYLAESRNAIVHRAMCIRVVLLVLCVGLSLPASCPEPVEEGAVLQLHDCSLDGALARHVGRGGLLVAFVAPWCAHCKRLAPELAQAAHALRTAGHPTRVAAIDASGSSLLTERYRLRGLPTLLFFKGTVQVAKEHDGRRDARSIVSFVAEHAAGTGVSSASTTTSAAAAQVWPRARGSGGAVMARQALFAPSATPRMLVFANQQAATFTSVLAIADEAARAREGVMGVTVVGANETQLMWAFQVDTASLPSAVIVQVGSDRRLTHFRLPRSPSNRFDSRRLLQFADAFAAGSLRPFLRSSAPDHGTGGTVELGADSLRELLAQGSGLGADAQQDVLLHCYASWCSHCIEVDAVFEQLAQKVAAVPSLLVARMDSADNDITDLGHGLRGPFPNSLPAVLLFAAGARERAPVAFPGTEAFSLDALMSLLRTHAGRAFDVEGLSYGGAAARNATSSEFGEL